MSENYENEYIEGEIDYSISSPFLLKKNIMNTIKQINRSKASRVISQYLIDTGKTDQMKLETFKYAVDIYEKRLYELADMYESHIENPSEIDRMGFFSDAWAAVRVHHID